MIRKAILIGKFRLTGLTKDGNKVPNIEYRGIGLSMRGETLLSDDNVTVV